jgi:hypothetical protein
MVPEQQPQRKQHICENKHEGQNPVTPFRKHLIILELDTYHQGRKHKVAVPLLTTTW